MQRYRSRCGEGPNAVAWDGNNAGQEHLQHRCPCIVCLSTCRSLAKLPAQRIAITQGSGYSSGLMDLEKQLIASLQAMHGLIQGLKARHLQQLAGLQVLPGTCQRNTDALTCVPARHAPLHPALTLATFNLSLLSIFETSIVRYLAPVAQDSLTQKASYLQAFESSGQNLTSGISGSFGNQCGRAVLLLAVIDPPWHGWASGDPIAKEELISLGVHKLDKEVMLLSDWPGLVSARGSCCPGALKTCNLQTVVLDGEGLEAIRVIMYK